MSAAKVLVTRKIAASPERLFDAWLDPEQAAKFLFATPEGKIVRCDIDPRVGGKFYVVDRRANGDAEHRGVFLAIDRPRRLKFHFRGPGTNEGEWSTVTVELALEASGCILTLIHEIPEKWASYAEPVRQGWTMILDIFSRQMETTND